MCCCDMTYLSNHMNGRIYILFLLNHYSQVLEFLLLFCRGGGTREEEWQGGVRLP